MRLRLGGRRRRRRSDNEEGVTGIDGFDFELCLYICLDTKVVVYMENIEGRIGVKNESKCMITRRYSVY